MAVVQVLNTGWARDSILATCARNIWLIAAIYNIESMYSHIAGQVNNIADILYHWTITVNPTEKLNNLLENYVWIDAHLD